MLRVEDLQTVFDTETGVVRAVDGVSFTLPRGGVLGIVGESGSGKSVANLSILRLVPRPPGRIVSGRIELAGVDLLALPERQMRAIRGKRIAMIFQDPMTSLNPYLSVGRQLTEVLEEHEGLGRRAARGRAVEMLARVGIPEPDRRFDGHPHEMSGGMRQRVMIAMALLGRPEVLLADEPTTALDVTVQAQILALVRDLRREYGTAVVLVTHDLGVVAGVADEVAVMYAGRIVEQAPGDRALRRATPSVHVGAPCALCPDSPASATACLPFRAGRRTRPPSERAVHSPHAAPTSPRSATRSIRKRGRWGRLITCTAGSTSRVEYDRACDAQRAMVSAVRRRRRSIPSRKDAVVGTCSAQSGARRGPLLACLVAVLVLQLVGSSPSAGSLPVPVGVRVGATVAWLGYEGLSPNIETSDRYGYFVAGHVDYPFTPAIAVELGLAVADQGGELEGSGTFYNQQVAGKATLKLTYVYIPVLLKVTAPDLRIKPFVKVGPQFGFLVSAKADIETSATGKVETDIDEGTKGSEVAFYLSGGVEFPGRYRSFLEVGYSHGLTGINETPNQLFADAENRVLTVTAGFLF